MSRSRYPVRNPELPEIPGAIVVYRPDLHTVNAWVAFLSVKGQPVEIARSPWKKLTHKQALRHMAAMG